MRKKALLVIAACMLLCMVAGAFTGCQTQENAAPQQEGAAPAEQEQSVDSAGTGGDGGASVSEGPDERSFTDSSGSVVRLDEGLLLPEGMTAAEYAERRLAHKGFGVEADGKGNEYQVRFLTVYFSEGCGEARARKIVEELGCEWWDGLLLSGGGPAIRATVVVPEGADEGEYTARFEAVDGVESASRVSAVRLASQADGRAVDSPDSLIDTNEQQRYHLFGAGFYHAWEIVTCDHGVTVAVFDSGKPKELLSDLDGNVDFDNAYDAINGWTGGLWVIDAVGHGTAVAGVISAIAGNGFGTDGASHDATVLPVKVTGGAQVAGSGTWDSTIRGLQHLDSMDEPPEVVNMSYGAEYGEGGIGNEDDDYDDVQEVKLLVNRLHDKGVVFVASAGNIDLFHPDDVPWYPAALGNVVSVGALAKPQGTDMQELLQQGGYSNSGLWDGSVTQSETDLCAYGEGITVLKPLPYDIPGFTLGEEDGTSLAAPQVSAAAALLKAQHPDWNAEQVEGRLFATTRLPDDFSDETGPGGTGGPDGVDDQGRYGRGALDAAAAVGWGEPSGASPATGGSLAELYARQAGKAGRAHGAFGRGR